ncbi:thioredoxin family protein [Rhodocyclaceae bacterium SMB388]
MTSILDPSGLAVGQHASPRSVLTIALCAEWCGTCREFRTVLEGLAATYPEIAFCWIDIEDDAEIVGNLEMESFPALLLVRDGVPLYFGTTLPTETAVVPLLRTVSRSAAPLSAIPDEVRAMLVSLRI